MNSSFRTLLFPIACIAFVLGVTRLSPAQEQPASAPVVGQPPSAEPAPAGPRVVAPDPETKAPGGTQLPPARRADASAAGASTPGAAPYVIGPLDVLFVRVWGNQNLTGLVDVRPDGMLSMPLIGEMKADGATVAEVREMIRARLEDFLIKPEVDVQVTKVNSKKFYIFGEVGRQGEFPLIGSITVLDALSNSGGFRDFANTKKIYILRGTQKLFFNYKEVSNGKRMEQNIKLLNGDRIFVP
jgi:polysaccharide export outer membrane protein